MRQWNRKLPVLVIVAGMAAAAPGCTWLWLGAAAGVGTYAYVDGDLMREFPRPQEDTYNAALRAASALDLKLLDHYTHAGIGRIKCGRADGAVIQIRVEPLASSSSKVIIRVGTFGDKTASIHIAERIKQEL